MTTLLPHRPKGNYHPLIACHIKYGWCTVQPSGGDSKWKRSERQGLKPSSFSPRLTSKRGFLQLEISAASTPNPTRQDRGGFYLQMVLCCLVFLFLFLCFLVVDHHLIRIESWKVWRQVFSVYWRLKLKASLVSRCFSVCLLRCECVYVCCLPSQTGQFRLPPFSTMLNHVCRGATPLHSRSVRHVAPSCRCSLQSGVSSIKWSYLPVLLHLMIMLALGVSKLFLYDARQT